MSRGEISLLPNDKISDQSKLNVFADDKLKVIQMATFDLDKKEYIVGLVGCIGV